MRKFSKILSRRLGREHPPDKDHSTSVSSSRDASLDFHQLSPRWGNVKESKILPRNGSSRIVVTGYQDDDTINSDVASDRVGEADKNVDATSSGEWAGKVCKTCRSIDFVRLLDWRPGQPRPWVGLSHTLQNSDCPFCIFLQTMIGTVPQPTQGEESLANEKFTPYLRIRRAFERVGGLNDKSELGQAVLIEITTKNKSLPWGCIIKARDQDAGQAHTSSDEDGSDEADIAGYIGVKPEIRGRTVTPMLDPRVPKAWINFCKENHQSEPCGRSRHDTVVTKLLDCLDQKVVPAMELGDDFEYVTLSYTTGRETPAETGWNENTEKLPLDMPQLFRDAITATKLLGYRYLWIDEYCMPIGESERRRQISQMGSIYFNSSLTLITTGSGSLDEGIPGISVAREDQLSLKTEIGLYITTLLRPDLDVASSRWSSRAWTFQEGLLSRRRLVFAPSQTYFQCQTLHCHESISLPLSLAPPLNFGRVFPPRPTTDDVAWFQTMIKSYIAKILTVQEERLDAFRGILQLYHETCQVDTFLGLPLFPPSDFKSPEPVSQTDRLAVALAWQADKLISSAAHTPAYRLAPAGYFPSWTWLSWYPRQGTSPSNHQFLFELAEDTSARLEGVRAAPGTEINVGKVDGTVEKWDGDDEVIDHARTKFLRMHGWCFDMVLFKKEAAIAAAANPSSISSPNPEKAQGEDEPEEDLELVQTSLDNTSQDAIKAWFRTYDEDLVSDGSEALPAGLYAATGVLLMGKNWTAEGHGVAAVLICARDKWEMSGHLHRVGIVKVNFKGWVQSSSQDAVLKAVTTEGKIKRDLKTQKRELDIY